uniref:hypothetical protein n=1 Tax=Candidatus Fimivicinus sp. TaxID=3056640 RepID=UPI003FEEF175
ASCRRAATPFFAEEDHSVKQVVAKGALCAMELRYHGFKWAIQFPFLQFESIERSACYGLVI